MRAAFKVVAASSLVLEASSSVVLDAASSIVLEAALFVVLDAEYRMLDSHGVLYILIGFVWVPTESARFFVLSDSYSFAQILTDSHRFLQILTDAYRCLLILTHPHRFQKFTQTLTDSQFSLTYSHRFS